jgi:uncharacterized UPF0160 family protein
MLKITLKCTNCGKEFPYSPATSKRGMDRIPKTCPQCEAGKEKKDGKNVAPIILKYKKIITHSGAFHADEVLAIVLLRYLGLNVPIERKNQVTAEELADPTILVLDVGLRLDPEFGNFDHHQDAGLDATCMLVLQHFVRDKKLRKRLADKLFQVVSDIDCGRIEGQRRIISSSFSSIIGNLRSLPEGFDVALDVAQKILEGYMRTAEQAIEGEAKWKTLETGGGGRFKAQDDATFIPDWEELAASEGVCMYLKPNYRIPGSYQILADTNVLRIPPKDTQLFLHNSGHMAVYASREDAVSHAEEIVAMMG